MNKSPLPSVVTQDAVVVESPLKLMDFSGAIKMVVDDKKITREEWNDKRTYGFMKDGLLQIHKAGESGDLFHPWIVNDGDILAQDWYAL